MSTDPLDTAPGDVPPPPRRPAASSPLRYELLRPLGKGNLGEVHVAFDQELHREVALKQIQEHLADHPDLRKRFLLEAEVTGRLEHPGIVPVYGLGCYADGRPFYAMRLIKGESLQEAITRFHQADTPNRTPGERGLALRGLLTRFVAVCNAVAYAHSRGVVHRDLKPANVMLGAYGETLVVDWGLTGLVARAEADYQGAEDPLTPRPESRPQATRGALGSPAYMSPEQASGTPALVGPASDVYSLGATLYHLLVGEPPFSKGSLGEVLEKVQRGDFPPPRARNRSVPSALEAVCLKAMAFRREDRYGSAVELGRDVEAWLADEPVSAWKEPFSERLRRWVKRHRAAVTAALAGGLVALLALAALAVLQRAANRKERELHQQTEEAFLREKRGLEVAQDTSSTLLQLAEDLRPAPGLQGRTLDRVLSSANRRYDELRRAAGDRAEVREGKARVLTALSETRVQLGDTTAALSFAREAEQLYRRLVQDAPEEPRLRGGLATALERAGAVLPLQGRYQEALAAHREALQLRAQLAREFPDESRWQLDLAKSHHWVGNLLNGEGDVIHAEREYRRAFDLRRRVVQREPNNRDAKARLALSHRALANLVWYHEERRDALRHLERAVALLDELLRNEPNHDEWQRFRTEAALEVSESLMEFRREKEAQALIEGCVNTARMFSGLDPTHAEWQRVLLRAQQIVSTLPQPGSPVARLRSFAATLRELLPVADSRARRDPANVEWQISAAGMRKTLASTLLSLALQGVDHDSNLRDSGKLLDEAEAAVVPLARCYPDRLALRNSLRGLHGARDSLLRAQGKPAHARRWPPAELDYYERRHKAEPDNLSWLWQLAKLYRGLRHPTRDRLFEVTCTRRAVALAEELRRREPENLRWLEMLQWAHETHAPVVNLLSGHLAAERHPSDAAASRKAQLASREYAEYLASARTALMIREKLAYLRADSPEPLRDLADAYRSLADDRHNRREFAGARAAYEKHLAALEQLYRAFPEEAKRDPFGQADISYDIVRPLFPEHLPNKRVRLEQYNRKMWEAPHSIVANELLYQLIDLVKDLDVSKPAEAAEARWALRRGLALFVSESASKPLPQPLALLAPFFEKHLSALPAPKREAEPGETGKAALDCMRYDILVEELAARRPRDLALLLAQEARDAAAVPWAAAEFRRRALLALLMDAESLAAVLRSAGELAREKADRLGAEGRKFFALLAVCAGNAETARQLDESAAQAGVEPVLALSLARKLDLLGDLRARAGKVNQAKASWKLALGLCPEKSGSAARLRKALEKKLGPSGP